MRFFKGKKNFCFWMLLAIIILLCGLYIVWHNVTHDLGISGKNSQNYYYAEFDDESKSISVEAIWGTKCLYRENQDGVLKFGVYDYKEQKSKAVSSVKDFQIQGRSLAFIEDKIYFYITVNQKRQLVNVLYEYDCGTDKMRIVCQNNYASHLIPLINLDNRLLALQADVDESGNPKRWIEGIGIDGTITTYELGNITDKDICYFDADSSYFYTIEYSDLKYYYGKYSHDMEQIVLTDITDIYDETDMTKGVGTFYAFGDFFCITDISCASVLCEVVESGVEILMYDRKLEYVVNHSSASDFEYFYVRQTNDIYQLNIKTGEVEKVEYNYNNQNGTSVIRYILRNRDILGIATVAEKSRIEKEKMYFVTCKS